VPEGVGGLPVGARDRHQDAARNDFPKALAKLARRQLDGRSQELVIETAARGRGRAKDLLGCRRQLGDPGEKDVLKPRRKVPAITGLD